jgi:hypothetical protein
MAAASAKEWGSALGRLLPARPRLSVRFSVFFLLFLSLPVKAGAAFPFELEQASSPLEINDPALYPATREFGPTVIPLASLPFESEVAVASRKPWSSYWFPKSDRSLFDGESSSLGKYDLARATLTDAPSAAAVWEKDHYNPDAPGWEGLCDAWAIAAILFPEPTQERNLRLNGGYHHFSNRKVSFSVGDQKALLLKSVESLPPDSIKVYGQKFLGDFDGWIYPDLLPQELHRFLEKQLFEGHQPFVMDHDPGVEVWSEPVYKANYAMRAVPGKPNAVFVRLWLYSAAPLRAEEKDRVGTKDIVREYNYYLYGEPDGHGNLVVSSGEWAKGDLVDSRQDHPDYVFVLKPEAKRHSANPEIDASIVNQILGY